MAKVATLLNGEKSKAPSKARPVQCKCGNPVCVDQWHRLARWLEKDHRNGRKLEAWLKAMWDEHREADRTFKAAPGLWLVWSGAKVEPTEEIAEPSCSPFKVVSREPPDVG